MAGTSWDRTGRMEAAFSVVEAAIRRTAAAHNANLMEYFRDDPVWRIEPRPGVTRDAVDVSWSEERPETYQVSAIWWEGAVVRRVEVGEFGRQQSLEELARLLESALAMLPQADQ